MDQNTVSIDEYAGGKNAHVVRVGMLTLYFSYQTCIAFQLAGTRPVVSENMAGTTTGKHINTVSLDKKTRLPWNKFQEKLSALLDTHKLAG